MILLFLAAVAAAAVSGAFHFHLCVVDGLFERIEGEGNPDPAMLTPDLGFHEAPALNDERDLEVRFAHPEAWFAKLAGPRPPAGPSGGDGGHAL